MYLTKVNSSNSTLSVSANTVSCLPWRPCASYTFIWSGWLPFLSKRISSPNVFSSDNLPKTPWILWWSPTYPSVMKNMLVPWSPSLYIIWFDLATTASQSDRSSFNAMNDSFDNIGWDYEISYTEYIAWGISSSYLFSLTVIFMLGSVLKLSCSFFLYILSLD